eukprot:Sspe_Gene.115397::Locus_102712_Transcript_1_1_Confidence_1.000_Length_701::g.115397::m.115397
MWKIGLPPPLPPYTHTHTPPFATTPKTSQPPSPPPPTNKCRVENGSADLHPFGWLLGNWGATCKVLPGQHGEQPNETRSATHPAANRKVLFAGLRVCRSNMNRNIRKRGQGVNCRRRSRRETD